MVSRRRRLGKYTSVRFADPPWSKDHSEWLYVDRMLPAEHLARRVTEAMQTLDLRPLYASYSAGGTRPVRPDLMLRVVLIEVQEGRFRPSQWCRDVREHIPLMWAGFGIRPSRSCWYEFADRIAPFLDAWNRRVLEECRRRGMTSARRGAQDGSTVAANASRHRLLNEERLAKRRAQLEAACAADAASEANGVLPRWMARTLHGRTAQRRRFQEASLRLTELQAIARRQPSTCRRPAEKIVVTTTDPQCALGRDKLKVFRPLYNVQLVRDLDSTFVLGYDVFSQANDNGTLTPILKRLRSTFGIVLETLLTDSAYVTGCNVASSRRQDITLCAPWRENDSIQPEEKKRGKDAQKYSKEKFTWLPDENAYRCPQGHHLTAIGKEHRLQSDGEVNTVFRYRCLPKHCRACPQRDACTSSPHRGRSLRRSEHEEAIESHKAYMQTDVAKQLYKLRRQTVELGFADIKEHRNLQRFSGRGKDRARRQLALTVLAHNLVGLSRERVREPLA